MRAQCIICTESLGKEKHVAAMPCGHTFHDGCLSQWLKANQSCPQCRKALGSREKPIRRLFFADPNDSFNLSMQAQDDPDKLRDMLTEHKHALEKAEGEKQAAESRNNELATQLGLMASEMEELKKSLHDEKASRAAMKKELTKCRQWEVQARQATSEADTLRTKLDSLEAIQKVVSGCEKDVQEVLAPYGVATGSCTPEMQKLSTIIALLRRELDSSRQDRRKLRNTSIELKQELANRKRIIAERDEQLTTLAAELDRCEADLQTSESECTGLRRRLNALSSAFESPAGNVGGSLAKRLLRESPAPNVLEHVHMTPVAAATTSAACGSSRSSAARASDGDSTVQLFDDSCYLVSDSPQVTSAPQAAKRAPAVDSSATSAIAGRVALEGYGKRRRMDDGSGMALTATSMAVGIGKLLLAKKPPTATASAAAAAPEDGECATTEAGDTASSMRDVSNVVGLGYDFGVVRKKESDSAFFRKGYNGLGGHGVHISTPTRRLGPPEKLTTKKRTIVLQKKKPQPPVPTLNDYVVID